MTAIFFYMVVMAIFCIIAPIVYWIIDTFIW